MEEYIRTEQDDKIEAIMSLIVIVAAISMISAVLYCTFLSMPTGTTMTETIKTCLTVSLPLN